jgi:hypothetical protein
MLTQLRQPNPAEIAFVPILTLLANLEDLSRKFRFAPERGADDLDEYDVVHVLETDSGYHFLLVRYAGSPKDQVELFVTPPARDRQEFAFRIAEKLGVPKSRIFGRKGVDHD